MKLETRRVFIGDLPENVKEPDLREKFAKYGRVSSVEVKQRKEIGPKNQSLFFAFVSLEVDNSSLQRCFEDFTNKKWKGQYIELQMAKESFLERLNKERKEAKCSATETKTDNLHIEQNGLSNNITLNLPGTSTYDTNKSKVKKPKLKGQDEDDDTHVSDIAIRNNGHNTVGIKLKIESVGNDPIIKIEKPKPKSKDPKRAEADSKRIKSMIEMKKGYQQQKLLIKNALSKIDTKTVNKIVFGDEQDLCESVFETEKIHAGKAKLLFDDDDDTDDNENKDYNFEIKEQFQGKKGQKLLELQSRYKQDERFALSSKFLEDGEDDPEDEQPKNKNDEKEEQLIILEEVLGHKINIKKKETEDDRKNRKTMLRFDPAHPDHAKYEVKTEEIASTKKKKKRKIEKVIEKEETRPVVSKEKFYEVAGDLKEALNVKESFSLLDTFGKIQSQDKHTTVTPEENVQKKRAKSHIKLGETNPFKYDSSDDESDNGNNEQFGNNEKLMSTNKDTAVIEKHLNLGPERLWTEPFFFRNDDTRLQEGIDFIKKVQAEETTEFSKIRRDLVEIVRAKVKNNQRRNRPFKKKLGGRKMIKIKRAMKR